MRKCTSRNQKWKISNIFLISKDPSLFFYSKMEEEGHRGVLILLICVQILARLDCLVKNGQNSPKRAHPMILTFFNGWMFSLSQFQFKSINFSKISISKLKTCVYISRFVSWLLLGIYMSHFSYACKMRYPLNLVLENCEYLWFYWTFWIVILDCGLKLHKLLIHILVMLQKWLEIH